MLRLINALEKPTDGSVSVRDIDVSKLSKKKLRQTQKHISMIFQQFNLVSTKTVAQNVAFAMEIAGRSKDEIKQRVPELLSLVGLSDRADVYPNTLSGGQKQRVAIARALINEPAVLFADEPSGNLDSKTKEEIHRLFFDLRDKYGQTVVIVTHDPDLAAMCDRSLTMVDGNFVI